MGTLLATILIIVGLMLGWVGIQSLWRRVFAAEISDPDVLAERRSCGNCGCTTVCTKHKTQKNYGTSI